MVIAVIIKMAAYYLTFFHGDVGSNSIPLNSGRLLTASTNEVDQKWHYASSEVVPKEGLMLLLDSQKQFLLVL